MSITRCLRVTLLIPILLLLLTLLPPLLIPLNPPHTRLQVSPLTMSSPHLHTMSLLSPLTMSNQPLTINHLPPRTLRISTVINPFKCLRITQNHHFPTNRPPKELPPLTPLNQKLVTQTASNPEY